jgi:hypothetical protein
MARRYMIIFKDYSDPVSGEYQTDYLLTALIAFIRLRFSYQQVDFSYRAE